MRWMGSGKSRELILFIRHIAGQTISSNYAVLEMFSETTLKIREKKIVFVHCT